MLPSLAIASALRERGVQVTFAGSPRRIEAELVPKHGYEFDPFTISGFPRRPSLALARALGLAAAAPAACVRIIRRRRPHVVLGGGGYVAGPMVLAARLSGVPAALTEADAHLGLANRLSAPFAQRVFLAYAIEGREPPKYRVTGRPVPPREPVGRAEARARFRLPEDGPVVLVAGGSQGAQALNDFALAAWGERGPAVLHLCGPRYHEQLAGRELRADYRLLPYVDDFGAAATAADLTVSRAGGTVWELAAVGAPAILVPSPNVTADHQTLNARHFERGRGAIVVPEPELERVPRLVEELLAAPERLESMRAAMLALARPNAADEIADELAALGRGARARG
ncbi:MAG TPA: UDP-N-acetylglucosamine--N-acetylmuramyl-(pentapeptide) pyrophosphoryl-undecaprenol N-acetylglucosamine transferase [Gaiellaceae bacterium]|nr:UDP-N-acetylglucosamine--N-acetylmuramyl-(pentapeptide) pyrophosphoryl-undecaprenol N-acetylglucosamine transferase [Gaiellaceae bacterium]